MSRSLGGDQRDRRVVLNMHAYISLSLITAVLLSVTLGSGLATALICDNNFYALNANTGAKVWNYTTGGGPSGPAIANGVVYVGSNDHNVYALNATTGSKLWSYTTGDAVRSSPAIDNGIVYVGSNAGIIVD